MIKANKGSSMIVSSVFSNNRMPADLSRFDFSFQETVEFRNVTAFGNKNTRASK